MGALAVIKSGNDVLRKLGVVRSLSQAAHNLALLGVGHLAISAVALILATPRFAQTQQPTTRVDTKEDPSGTGCDEATRNGGGWKAVGEKERAREAEIRNTPEEECPTATGSRTKAREFTPPVIRKLRPFS